MNVFVLVLNRCFAPVSGYCGSFNGVDFHKVDLNPVAPVPAPSGVRSEPLETTWNPYSANRKRKSDHSPFDAGGGDATEHR